MTDLARLTIQLTADSARLQRDLDKAQSQINRYQARTNAAFTAAAKKIGTGIGIAVAAAATGLVALVKNSIDAADELNKLSQKVGIATDDLSKLQYAAKLADVETAALQTSLVKLSKSAVDAADGTGDSAAAFKALGVDVKDANGQIKSSYDLLLETAEAFSQYEDGVEKTAAAVAIFGKAGADMIPLLNGGRKAIEEAGDELERFGGVVTPEAAKQAEIFNDNLTRLKSIASGAANELSADLLPALVQVTDAFVELRQNDDLKQFARDTAIALAVVAESLVAVAKLARAVGGSFEAVFADLKLLGTVAGSVGGKGLGVTTALEVAAAVNDQNGPLAQALEERNKTVKEANDRYTDLWNYNGKFISDAIKRSFEQADAAIANYTPDLSNVPTLEDMFGSGGKKKLGFSDEKNADKVKAAANKAAEERKKIVEASAQAESTIFKAGLDRRQSALEAALELQRTTQEQYYRDLETIQKEGIDQEIKQRQAELATADPAERIKLLAEIEAFQTKRLQVSEETDAKIAASNKKLTDALSADLAAYADQLNTLGKSYQRALDQFGKGPAQQRYDEGRNSIDDDVSQQRMGLESQRRSGDIGQDQYNDSIKALENFHSLAIDQWNTYYDLIEERSRDFGLGFEEAFAQYADAVKNVGATLGQDLTSALDSAISQTSELAANTILWGEGGTEALKALGRSIITDIVSSLIKVGLQMAVNFALQQAISAASASAGAAATAAAFTEASALAGAWTTAAIGASIATFGGAAGIGSAAYIAALAGGTAAAAAANAAGGALAGHKAGGYTGNGSRDAVAGYVHGQEGVINTNALAAAAETLNDPNFWTVSRNATSAMAGGAAQINIVNQPGIVTVRQDDGSLLNRLAPALLDMVDIDQARRADSQLGRNYQATVRKLGAQPSAGR